MRKNLNQGNFNHLTLHALAALHLAGKSGTKNKEREEKKELLGRSVHLLQKSGLALSSLGQLGEDVVRENHHALSARTTSTAGAYESA